MKDKEKLELQLQLLGETQKRLAAEFQLVALQKEGVLERYNRLKREEKEAVERTNDRSSEPRLSESEV